MFARTRTRPEHFEKRKGNAPMLHQPIVTTTIRIAILLTYLPWSSQRESLIRCSMQVSAGMLLNACLEIGPILLGDMFQANFNRISRRRHGGFQREKHVIDVMVYRFSSLSLWIFINVLNVSIQITKTCTDLTSHQTEHLDYPRPKLCSSVRN